MSSYLCYLVSLSGHKSNQRELVERLKLKKHDVNRISWMEHDIRNPPTLIRLARSTIRSQLILATKQRTILPAIIQLVLPHQLQRYLKFEGVFSEIDLSIPTKRCIRAGR